MARVLITRPLEAATTTVAAARALGHDVLLAPVMAIVPVSEPLVPAVPFQALLVTSRHAVEAIVDGAPAVPIFAVGEGTAAMLRRHGIAPQAVAAGDGRSLGHVVAAHCDPAAGPLGHPTGEVRAGGLEAALVAAGFDYRPWIVYRAEAATELPGPVLAALDAGAIDAVTLHSPRSARLFAERLRAVAREDTVANIVALALSANVARAAQTLAWREVRTAPQPDERGMGALLEDLCH